MKTLKLILASILLLTFFNCEPKDNSDEIPETKEIMLQNYGRVNWILDNNPNNILPDYRGIIRIYNNGPCISNGVQVPCDPLTEIVIPCEYPNGLCLNQFIEGNPYTINNNQISIQSNSIGVLEITLPYRVEVNQDEVFNQLNNNPEINYQNKLELVSIISSTYSFKEDTELSNDIVSYFKSHSTNKEFNTMIILGRDYKIHFDEERPNGYIKAYVKAF